MIIFPATASQSAGSWVLLETQVISGTPTSVDFENFIDDTNYDIYIVELTNVRPTTDATNISIQIGTGGTPTYQTGTVYKDSTLTEIRLGISVGNVSDESASGHLYMYNPSDTAYRTLFKAVGASKSATAPIYGLDGIGDYSATTAVTAIRIKPASGTFADGTLTLYGLKK